MGEVFVRSFNSVFSPVLPQVVNLYQESRTELRQMHLTIDKVFSHLNKLDKSSAPKSDRVKPKLLKSYAATLSYPLLLIYIERLRDGKLPLA